MNSHASRARSLLAIIALVVLSAIPFSPALFGGKILAPLDILTSLLAPWNESAQGAKPHNHFVSDAVTQYLPYRVLVERAFREDGYIGWNPYEMGGYNLAANTMATPAAWTMQLHRILSFKDAWNYGIYAEFLIAGIGMLIFLRQRNLPWLPCIIGSLAFMLNSQFVIWIHHRWALGAFCWMPWIMWSAAGFNECKKITARRILLPIFIALAFLGGSLQHMAFVFMACACLFLGACSSLKNLRPSFNNLTFWAIAFSFATLIASFSLIPQIQAYLINNELGHVRGQIGYEHGTIQPILQSLLIPIQVWPWLVGDAQTLDGFKLIKSNYMDLAYLGTIPMILALLGCFERSMPKQAKWLIAIGLLVPLTPLVGALYHRVQLLFLLGGAWMAAEMLAKLNLVFTSRYKKILIFVAAAIGFVLLSATALPKSARQQFETKVIEKSISEAKDSQFGQDLKWIEKRALEWTQRISFRNSRTSILYAILLMGIISLIILSKHKSADMDKAHRGIALQLCILTCVFIELTMVFNGWCKFSPLSEFYPHHTSIDTIKKHVGDDRIHLSSSNSPLGTAFAAPNTLICYGIRAIDAYESIHYPRILAKYDIGHVNDRLSLSNVVASVESLSATNQSMGETLALWKKFKLIATPNPVPYITAGSGSMPKNLYDLPNALRAADPISPSLRTMSRISASVGDSKSWIRFAENWHPGWKWRTLDGDWKPTTKGSDSAIWIDLSAEMSCQHIEVKFFPYNRILLTGSMLALISLGLLLILYSVGILGSRSTPASKSATFQ